MKILLYFFVLLFLSFAALQWNDPDPWNWIILYGYMAAVCWITALGKFNRTAIVIGLVAYGVYAILLAPSFWQWLQSPDRSALFDEFAKMQNLYIEETREFLGLIICTLVLTFILLVHKRQKT